MALSREFDTSDPDVKYKENLWKKFESQYDYVGNSGRFIRYPDKEFREQGIPNPWQIIFWRRIIRELGEENFCGLKLHLNYLRNDDVLFERQFKECFSNSPDPKKLKVTFFCGYFWLFTAGRREKMLKFIVNSLLEKGTRVEICTQDKTLKKAFNKVLGNSPARANLSVEAVKERIGVHFTLIEDNNALDNSLLSLELPHTEAHLLRLETYLTFGELKKFGCKPSEFVEILRSYKKPDFSQRRFSRRNLALNTEQNKR